VGLVASVLVTLVTHSSIARAQPAPEPARTPAPAPAPLAPLAPSHPEPSAGDLATARNALKEGLALREKGDLLGALGRFSTAFDLVQTPVTGFELGKTHLLLGHILQAHELFKKIGRIPPALEESQRSATARSEAARLAADLEPRIPTLRIKMRLPDEATAVVHIDDDPITTTGVVTPRSVEPGKHVVSARAGEGPEEKVTIEIGEGETKDVELAPQWVPPKVKATDTAVGQVVYVRQTNPLVFVGLAGSSVAVSLTILSSVLAVNAAGRAKDHCGDSYCPQYVRDGDVRTMRTWLAVMTVSGALAIGFFTLGIASISRPVTEKVTTTAKVRVKPWVGPGSAGLVGDF
jgi:hypothetical protein